MRWQFWQSAGGKELPSMVQKTLEAEFRLNPQEMSRLRCVEKAGEFAGWPVRRIRIFDPALLGNTGKPVQKYDDLTSRREALLFEGHIDKKGLVILSDARPSEGSASNRTGTTPRG